MSVVGNVIGFLIQTLAVSSIYILVAIGLSITLGPLNFVNFAHAPLYLAGVYIGLIIAFELPFSVDIPRPLGLHSFVL
mgnify:CR=1 FL=1